MFGRNYEWTTNPLLPDARDDVNLSRTTPGCRSTTTRFLNRTLTTELPHTKPGACDVDEKVVGRHHRLGQRCPHRLRRRPGPEAPRTDRPVGADVRHAPVDAG